MTTNDYDKIVLEVLSQIRPENFGTTLPFKVHSRENNLGGGSENDSLYFTKQKGDRKIIYITPHIIFFHKEGKMTVDFLSLLEHNHSVIPRPTL